MEAMQAGLRGAPDSEEADARWTLEERMEHYRVPGVSIAVLRDGEVAWARGFGVIEAGTSTPVDAETVFSVGSVSKMGTAAAVLRLVDDGRLELDTGLNGWLTRWTVPENDFTRRTAPTLRRTLSHTAGFTVHGFADFQPGEELPTLVEILEGGGPAKNPPIEVDVEPGTIWRYSGGGTTVQSLVVEEVTGMAFHDAARTLVFEPLGMDRSSYENPLPAEHGNIARAHSALGRPRALPRGWEAMPENAASGLWTTPTDVGRMIAALIASWRGEPDAFLSQELAREMMTEVAPGSYGLGPQLSGEGATRRFMHGGSNDSYKAFMVGFLESGNGAVVMTNGARGGELWSEIVRAIAAAEGWPVTEVR